MEMSSDKITKLNCLFSHRPFNSSQYFELVYPICKSQLLKTYAYKLKHVKRTVNSFLLCIFCSLLLIAFQKTIKKPVAGYQSLKSLAVTSLWRSIWKRCFVPASYSFHFPCFICIAVRCHAMPLVIFMEQIL